MDVLSQLSSATGARTEVANVMLAEKIAKSDDRNAVAVLVRELSSRQRAVRNACIKTLYEVGQRDASLIARHVDAFLALLSHRDNRLNWGAMTALHTIARHSPKLLEPHLNMIAAAADAGSVITRDHVVGVMVELAERPTTVRAATAELARQLEQCPANQLGMYAEMASRLMSGPAGERLQKILRARLPGLPKESQQKRLAKVIGAAERAVAPTVVRRKAKS